MKNLMLTIFGILSIYALVNLALAQWKCDYSKATFYLIIAIGNILGFVTYLEK